jgi:peptide/nickel transport system substrate-binding protein
MKVLIRTTLVLVIVLLLGFGPTGASGASPSGVLKQAIHWNISADWLDPAISSLSSSAYLTLYLLHDSLIKPMPEGPYAPCLAQSWTISPDSKVYEFRLRRNVKFHNGDPMTAEDVVFSFWRYKAAHAKAIHERTEKVEAPDPYTVRFRFKEPFPDFLDYFIPGVASIGWVVPKKYIEQVGDAGYKRQPIGCGPYKFVEFSSGIRLIVEAFDQFWRKTPQIKRMEFHSILETATRLVMVKRGEVDIATLMTGVFYDDAKKDPNVRLFTPLSPVPRIVYIASQWDPKSPWSDPRVRKAASLAIDRQTLADVHMPGTGPIGGIGLQGDPLTVQFPPDPYDPNRARKLLAEAGYPKGFHGGKYYPNEGGYWPYCEQVANYWKAVGISVDTILLDRPAWWANREGGKMKGAVFVDPVQSPMVAGCLSYLLGPGSYGSYPDIQALWERYRKEIEPQARKDLIHQVQRMIQERTVWIPLTSTNSPAAAGPRVKGNPWKTQPIIWFTAPFEDMELVEK